MILEDVLPVDGDQCVVTWPKQVRAQRILINLQLQLAQSKQEWSLVGVSLDETMEMLRQELEQVPDFWVELVVEDLGYLHEEFSIFLQVRIETVELKLSHLVAFECLDQATT